MFEQRFINMLQQLTSCFINDPYLHNSGSSLRHEHATETASVHKRGFQVSHAGRLLEFFFTFLQSVHQSEWLLVAGEVFSSWPAGSSFPDRPEYTTPANPTASGPTPLWRWSSRCGNLIFLEIILEKLFFVWSLNFIIIYLVVISWSWWHLNFFCLLHYYITITFCLHASGGVFLHVTLSHALSRTKFAIQPKLCWGFFPTEGTATSSGSRTIWVRAIWITDLTCDLVNSRIYATVTFPWNLGAFH